MADGSRDMDATGPSSNRTQWGAICAQKCTVPGKKWQFTVVHALGLEKRGLNIAEMQEGVIQRLQGYGCCSAVETSDAPTVR